MARNVCSWGGRTIFQSVESLCALRNGNERTNEKLNQINVTGEREAFAASFKAYKQVWTSVIRIFDAQGKEISTVAGPFREGHELFLSCQVSGGE